jgi:hypothetical protein
VRISPFALVIYLLFIVIQESFSHKFLVEILFLTLMYMLKFLIHFGEHFCYCYQYYIWRRRLLDAIDLCLGSYSYFFNMRKLYREGVAYGPMLNRDISEATCLDRLYNGTEAHCISEL